MGLSSVLCVAIRKVLRITPVMSLVVWLQFTTGTYLPFCKVFSHELPHLFPQTVLLYSQQVLAHNEAQRVYVTPQDLRAAEDRAHVRILSS